MNLAQVENGIVTNVIVVDPNNIPDWASNYPETQNAGIGWLYDGENFHPPIEITEPKIYPPISARQLRLTLLQNGITSQDVINKINQIPDPIQKEAALIEFEYAIQFERDNPLLNQIGSAFELTEEMIDTMWESALEL